MILLVFGLNMVMTCHMGNISLNISVLWWLRSCPWIGSSGIQYEFNTYGYDPNICSKEWFCLVHIDTFHVGWYDLAVGTLVV